MSKVDSFMVDDGAVIYYSDSFRRILEDHMTFLRNASSTTVMQIQPISAYRWEGDLNGLLLEIGIPLYLHWVVMRMNNMTSPQEVPADLTQLLISSPSEIDMIRQSTMTANRIT